MKQSILTALAATALLVSAVPIARASDSDKKAAPGAFAATDEYRLGAGDKLRIEVYKDDQLSQSVQIRPAGATGAALYRQTTAAPAPTSGQAQ